ncbi:aromatic ring-hydroxylating oxygenase subunit alpha [Candidatus Poriferisocius sp.]|uniref:aromatic ring-hydroxylating oxygenase subunit alpha n=1 Tax=Candidatus Poriferisocius sp. TaxID=3101276 RepID=UPI003B02BB73
MRRETQVKLIRELLDHNAAGTTQLADDMLVLPAEVYVSEHHWQAEREALFRRRPVVACLAGAVASAGDFVSLTAGGVPLVVVRGDDGVLRGFRNVCRHRASSVVSGCGTGASSLRCPFHAWTYRLDGSLLARPQAGEGFAETDESELGLVPAPVGEASGLVFVRPEGGDPVNAAELVGDAAQDLGDFGVGQYVPFDRWESSWPCNWKLLVDTFLESYHVFSLHRSTVGRYYLSQPMTYQGYGPNLRFQTCQKSVLELAEVPEDEWDLLSRATVEYLIAPNTILSHSVDHFAVYQFLPTAVDRTDVTMTLYTPEPPTDRTQRHYERTLELHQEVGADEDFPQAVKIQQSLDSGLVDETLVGRHEVALIHFHQALDELLEGGNQQAGAG